MAQSGTIETVDPVNSAQEELLSVQQELWITFVALGGLMTMESDKVDSTHDIRQMTISEFSEKTGIPRRTLYNWKQSIPNFSHRVRARRREVFSKSRETVLFNRAYLIALTSKDHKAAGEMIKMLLGHFSELELPVQRQEIEAGQTLAELINVARRKKLIEGQVSERTDNNAPASA